MLNDVWYNLNQRVMFLTRNTFDKAPDTPGVYAWYYPLKVTTYDIQEFMNEILTVMAYDATAKGTNTMKTSVHSTWRQYELELAQSYSVDRIPAFARSAWERQRQDDFETLRADLLRLSLFVPPLYVGKTNSLSRRISEHLEGRALGRDFHDRFEKFASAKGLSHTSVSDLLCVVVLSSGSDQSDEYVKLIEYVVKTFSAPGFSVL